MPSKYKNIKVTASVNGEKVVFDSKKELKRYQELRLLQKAGKITELTLQPKYLLLDTLKLDGHKTMAKRSYVADFKYIQDEKTIIEDVKASAKFQDPMFRIKKHLFLAKYGHELEFREVY